MGRTVRGAEKVEYKRKLWKDKEIDCPICPLHKSENGLGRKHRVPKDDRKKNHRRLK